MGTIQNRSRTVTWLHLSDVHCHSVETGWNAGRVLKALDTDLKSMEDRYGLSPDLLFFTGDLAYGHVSDTAGNTLKDQFGEGGEFLNRVCSIFSQPIASNDVFIVPGNHDVDRRYVTEDQTSWLDLQRDPDVIDLLQQRAGIQWLRFMERLSAFRDFLSAGHFPLILKSPSHLEWATQRDINGVKVGIGGFNTAWSCGRDNEAGKLWVGTEWQSSAILPELNSTDVRIALMHHPSNWITPYENRSFARIIQREFQFALHGHEHDTWIDELKNQHTTIAAGACYEWSRKPAGYNIVRLDFDAGIGNVWLRRYDDRGAGWIPDVIAHLTDETPGVYNLANFRGRLADSGWTISKIATVVREAGIVMFCHGSREQPTDGFTKRLIDLMSIYGYPYTIIDMDSEGEAIEVNLRRYNDEVLPQIYIGGQFIGGSDAMLRLHERDELEGLMRAAFETR